MGKLKKAEKTKAIVKPSIEQIEKTLALFMKEFTQIQSNIEFFRNNLERESTDSTYDSESKCYGNDYGEEGETEPQALQRRQLALCYLQRTNQLIEPCYKSNLAMHELTKLLGYAYMWDLRRKYEETKQP